VCQFRGILFGFYETFVPDPIPDDREVQADHLVLNQELEMPMTMTTPRLHSAGKIDWPSTRPILTHIPSYSKLGFRITKQRRGN
jgi:hypothetical protein